MNDLVKPGPLGSVSKFFAGPVKDELGAGIQSSYGVVTFKGKVWRLNYRGDGRPLMRKDGDGPQASIDVVIVRTAEHISKTWFEEAYIDGSAKKPDCFSNDGVKPDNNSPKKQNSVCATCKQNAWGSRISQQAGQKSKGKACQDNKRLAIVPLDDIQNEMMGGPMLLRVPPASLQDLALYGSALTKHGYPPCAVATRIGFNTKDAYPHLTYQAIRVLSDDEAQQILEIQKRPILDRILAETGERSVDLADAAPEGVSNSPFEEPEIRVNPENREESRVTIHDYTPGQELTTQSIPPVEVAEPPAKVELELDSLLQKLIPN